MRPNEEVYGEDTFECFDCGARTTAPTARSCEQCGGRLMHVGRERDL